MTWVFRSRLNHHRQALADTDADGGYSVAAAAALQLVREATEDTHAGGAERVADRDRATVRVDRLRVEIPPLRDVRQALRREGLVQLDDVHIVPANPGPLQRLVRSFHRTKPEDVGIDGCGSARDDPGERLGAQALDAVVVC